MGTDDNGDLAVVLCQSLAVGCATDVSEGIAACLCCVDDDDNNNNDNYYYYWLLALLRCCAESISSFPPRFVRAGRSRNVGEYRHIPQERRPHLHRDGCLKLRVLP